VYKDTCKDTSFFKAQYPNADFWQSNVKLMESLDQIAQDKSIVREYDFHSAIQKLIRGMDDAHTQYTSNCFSAVTFVQPLLLAYRYSGNSMDTSEKPEIYFQDVFSSSSFSINSFISPSKGSISREMLTMQIDQLLSNFNSMPTSSFVGATIVKIDGMDAVEVIQKYSNDRGVYRDPAVRFNTALQSYAFGEYMNPDNSPQFLITPKDGSFGFRRELPAKSAVTYTLQMPNSNTLITVDLPWISIASKSKMDLFLQGRDVFYQGNCQDPTIVRKRDFNISVDIPLSNTSSIPAGRSRSTADILTAYDTPISQELELNPYGGYDPATLDLNMIIQDYQPPPISLDGNAPNLIYASGEGGFFQIDSSTGVWVIDFNLIKITDLHLFLVI
jgi:hypothetical protein